MSNSLLDQICDFDARNREHIDSLKRDSKRVLPLIGAGMSAPFGCLLLDDLARMLATRCLNNVRNEACTMVENAIANGNLQSAIDALDERRFYNGHMHLEIKEHFEDIPINLSANSTRYGSFEKIINRMNSPGTVASQLILTTNYDSVIEKIIADIYEKKNTKIECDIITPYNAQELLGVGIVDKLRVLKFHGNYAEENSLVLTSNSFKSNYGIIGNSNDSDIQVDYRGNRVCSMLKKVVSAHSILFLGCSLNEDLFIKLFRDLSTFSSYRHYAILSKPEDNDKANEKRMQARRMNTSVIWVQKDKREWVDWIIDHVFTLSQAMSSGENVTLKENGLNNGVVISESMTLTDHVECILVKRDAVVSETLQEFFKEQICVTEVASGKHKITVPMYKIGGGMYEIYLTEEDGKLYLSDCGATYMELDRIFEMNAADVQKNLRAILKHYGCIWFGDNSIVTTCSRDNVHIEASNLIQAISFLLNMKIFYV